MLKTDNLLKRIGVAMCPLLIAGSVMLAGCNMDSLGGPDLSASQDEVGAAKTTGGPIYKTDGHNEEDEGNKTTGGPIYKTDGHNEEDESP